MITEYCKIYNRDDDQRLRYVRWSLERIASVVPEIWDVLQEKWFLGTAYVNDLPSIMSSDNNLQASSEAVCNLYVGGIIFIDGRLDPDYEPVDWEEDLDEEFSYPKGPFEIFVHEFGHWLFYASGAERSERIRACLDFAHRHSNDSTNEIWQELDPNITSQELVRLSEWIRSLPEVFARLFESYVYYRLNAPEDMEVGCDLPGYWTREAWSELRLGDEDYEGFSLDDLAGKLVSQCLSANAIAHCDCGGQFTAKEADINFPDVACPKCGSEEFTWH